MKRKTTSKVPESSRLPVPPEELRRRFPSVTEDELAAYVEVTQRIMSAPNRAAVVKEVLVHGRETQDKVAAGQPLDEAGRVAHLYLAAITKMQASTGSSGTH